MTKDKRFDVDTHPRPAYSGPEFHKSFLAFMAAQTLRSQYQTLENLMLSASRVTIRDKTFTSMRQQSKYLYYATLPATAGIRHLFRRTPDGFKLDTILMTISGITQPTAIAYEFDETQVLTAVRAHNSQIPLFDRSTELDTPFVETLGTPVFESARTLRQFVAHQVLTNLVAVRGSVLSASETSA